MVPAFLALGFLVGNLTALSGSPIATALVPAIFALAGGSILALLSKLSEKDRPVASSAILSFSLACLVGTYLGIVVTTHQLLGPAPAAGYAAKADNQQPRHYLRAADSSELDTIDQRVRAGTLNPTEAYERLRNILKTAVQ